MTTLPDLDTANVGFVAYWNAIDQGGVSDIDPDEVLSNGNITSYTLYDNGVDGRYTLSTGREASFRVKEDGWMLTYMDRTNDFSKDVSSPVRGYWDVVRDVNRAGDDDVLTIGEITPQITPTVLEEELNTLRGEFSNSSSMNFSYADVGVYNYEYSGSTTLTVLGDGVGSSGARITPGLTYTSSTTLDWFAAQGAVFSDRGGEPADAEFAGTILANSENDYGQYGAVDVIAQGLAPNSGTEYAHTLDINDGGDCNAAGASVVLWH